MKKIFKNFLILLALSFLFVSCSSYKQYDQATPPTKNEASPEDEALDQSYDFEQEGRKIVGSYWLNFSTEEFDKSLEEINSIIEKNKAYIISTDQESYQSKYINMQLRVSSKDAKDFVNEISTIKSLKLKNKSLTTEDLTSSYRDRELRLEVLNEKLERLKELEKSSQDTESLLTIETELSNTILEIERIKAENKDIDKNVDYSQVNIEIYEVGVVSDSENEIEFSTRIKNALDYTFISFINILQDTLIFIIYLFPYLVIIIPLFFLARFIYRKLKERKIKKEKQKISKPD